MKFRYPLFAAVFSLLAFAGCQQKEDPVEPSLEISKTSLEFSKDGGSTTLTLTSTIDWGLRDYTDEVKSWLVVDPSDGQGSAFPETVTIRVSPNEGVDRSAAITFFGSVMHKQTLVITQAGSKGETETLTVKEFLSRKDKETEYKVTGKVGVISNSASYYGCYLKDETGELCVAFPKNWKDYSSIISTGGTATVKGRYSFYESKSQDQMADGEILEYTAPSASTVQSLSVADFLSRKDSYSIYRLTGTVASPVNATYCSFDLKDDTGTVKVYTVNNASEWGGKVKQNGKVTLRGAYTTYNGTPEVVDAWIESFEEGEPEKKLEGPNLLSNGDFEKWTGDTPAGWMQINSNATVAPAGTSHGGKYSASVTGKADSNARIMSKSYTLKPGTYQLEVFTKGEGVFRMGYAILSGGKVASSNDYIYINDATPAGSDWTDSYGRFTLDGQTSVSVIVMNSKNGAGAPFLLDDVSLVTEDGGVIEDVPILELSKDSFEFDRDGGPQVLSLTSTLDWSVKGYTEEVKSWLEITPSSGLGSSSAVSVTVKASENTGEARSATVTFFAGETLQKTVTITQSAKKVEIQTVTVAEFLSKKDPKTVYRLKGTVASTVNAAYCSFDLKDDTGTVKVYTVNNASEWGSVVKQHGTVTLRGVYTTYKDTPEVVDAWIEEFIPGTDPVPTESLSHPLVSTVTWKLGASAYDNTSSGSKQSATVNGVAVDNLLKLGTSSKPGDATLTIPEGKTRIGFYAGGWWPSQTEQNNGITTGSKVRLTIGEKTVDVARVEGVTGNAPYTVTLTDALNHYEVEVSAGEVKVSSEDKSGFCRVAVFGITAY